MVNLYPRDTKTLKDKGAPRSERIIHRLFKCLDDKWYVWHSVEWLKKDEDEKVQFGESDFLIFHPEYGFLVLEVKGGKLKREIKRPWLQAKTDFCGEWTRDYYNDKGKMIKDQPLKESPFIQARKSMFYFKVFYVDLVKNFKKLDPDNEAEYNKLLWKNDFPGNYHFGVIFPGCSFKKENLSSMREVIEEMVFDASDKMEQDEWMKNPSIQQTQVAPIKKYLLGLFGMQRKRNPPDKLEEFFVRIINYQINTKLSLNSWLDDQQYILDEINKVQEFILDLLECKNRCLFNGSAGTGKTYIALKKYMREIIKGHRVLFLCYNRKLSEFLTQQLTSHFGALSNKSKISTIDKLLYDFANSNLKGAELEYYNEQLEKKQYHERAKILKNIIIEKKSETSDKYDSIIVDEGQDIRNEYWPLIHLLLKDDNSVFYVFYDQTQAKFNDLFDPKEIGLNLNSDMFILRKNLRNADEIIKWVKDETLYGEYNEFLGISTVKQDFGPENYLTLEEALVEAIKRIKRIHYNSFINPQRFTLLCDKKLEFMVDENDDISKEETKKIYYFQQKYIIEVKSGIINYYLIETRNLNDIKKLREARPDDIIISYNGIGTFKGLENDIIMVVIQKPDKNSKKEYEKYRQDLYIGASRAKFLLYVYTYSE